MKYFLLIWNNCEQFKIITEVSLMMLRYIRADGRFGFLISSHHPVSEQLGKINNMLIIQINLATILKWNVWLHVLSVYPPPSSHFKWVREQCTRTVQRSLRIHIVIVTYNITDNVLTHPLPSCNWEKYNSNRDSPETCFSTWLFHCRAGPDPWPDPVSGTWSSVKVDNIIYEDFMIVWSVTVFRLSDGYKNTGYFTSSSSRLCCAVLRSIYYY